MWTMLLLAATLGDAAPEFQPDPRYRPASGDTALLHATGPISGKPAAVVVGREASAYLRHLDREFRDSAAALAGARSDPELVVLPYGTEVVVERTLSDRVVAGKREIERRLLVVRLIQSPAQGDPLLVLENHVQRPGDPAVAARDHERYKVLMRARREAEEARRAARWAALRRSRDEFQAQQVWHLDWFRETAFAAHGRSSNAAAPASPRSEGTLVVKNLRPTDVSVILEGQSGRDRLDVAARTSATTRLPNGRYKVYFKYASDRGTLYRGKDIELSGPGASLTLGTENGNYPIRRVDSSDTDAPIRD